jgi:16S rRNA (guanine966-N2)-methyltransferase
MRIFSGFYKGRILQVPKGSKTRPTSGRLREALFNICQGSMEQVNFLDLFAGSGAVGIEALSHGASSSTFVDNSQESVRCIYANIESLGVANRCKVFYGDVFDTLNKLIKKGEKYDIIYADPPYEVKKNGIFFSIRLLEMLDELIETNHSLLSSKGVIFIEDSEKALSDSNSFKHLLLKKTRKMGRSALQQYEILH